MSYREFCSILSFVVPLLGCRSAALTPHVTPVYSTQSFSPCRTGMALIDRGRLLVMGEPVPPFCMMRFEVTVEEFEHCVMAGRCPRDVATEDLRTTQEAPFCSLLSPTTRTMPKNCVGHGAAANYCGVYGMRLPEWAEWEAAYRGIVPVAVDDLRVGDGNFGTHYQGITDVWISFHGYQLWEGVQLAPFDDGFEGVAPVGSFARDQTVEGVFDLRGNVSEWTAYINETEDGAGVGVALASGLNFATFDRSRWQRNNGVEMPEGVRSALVGFRCVADVNSPRTQTASHR